MLFSSRLRNWKRSGPTAPWRTQSPPRRRASMRPRLEAIEDRCLMSTAIVQTNLVSDDTKFTPAQVQDKNLVNPWGLAASPTGEWWVANEGTGTSTLYKTSTSRVTTYSLVFSVPPSSAASAHGTPTGIVYNPGGGFDVSENGKTGSSVFLFDNVDGQLLERPIRPGDIHINQPWATAMAPSNFGSFSNDLLVGNFGDGTIGAFNPRNGQFVGELKNAKGQPIAITHLWGLAFGNGREAGPKNTLYFTAGLTSHLAPSDNPFHGAFGSLQIARPR
jgi:hypothetical protein